MVTPLVRMITHSPWRRALLMMLLFPLALIWGELFTRVLLPQQLDSRMNIFKGDPVAGFIFEPGSSTYETGREYRVLYEINSDGIRDREYGNKKSSHYRVLLLGDSFSVSHGLTIEDSLSRQLERALQAAIDIEKSGVTVQVINGAVGGYSPFNYWKAYQRWDPVYKPDVAVVALSPDDYEVPNEYATYMIEKGITLKVARLGDNAEPKRAGIIRRARKWLSWNSHIYILLRNFFYYNEIVGRISLRLSGRGEPDLGQFKQYAVSRVGNIWVKAFSYFQLLFADTMARDVPLIMVRIPMKIEIDAEEQKLRLDSLRLTDDELNLDRPLREISQLLSDSAIPLLDPRPALREHHSRERCYFVYDGHWNAEGISVAADSLIDQWQQMRLPPFNSTP